MRKSTPLAAMLFLAISALLFTSSLSSCVGGRLSPPVTQTGSVVDTLHGIAIPDPYRWLEDQQSQETRDWIDAQNEYSQAVFDGLTGRDKIRERYAELLKKDQVSIPLQRGNRYFYKKRAADQELHVIYMREGLHGEDKLLVDPHPMSTNLTTSVDIEDITNDGRIMAYHIRDGGADETVIKFMNVETKENLPDEFPLAVYFGVFFTEDGKGVYYSKSLNELSRVYYHRLGSDLAEDKMIFGEGYGREKIVSIEISEDRRYLLIYVYYGSSSNNEIYYVDLQKDNVVKTLVKDIPASFEGYFADDKFIMKTEWEAPNYRVLAVNLSKPAQKNWHEVIPESENPIEYLSLAGGKLFVNYLINVSSHVKIFDLDGKSQGEIPFPLLGSVGKVYGRGDSKDAFFSFGSFTYPKTVFHYNVEDAAMDTWHSPDISINTEDFEVKQVWYESKDGTRVPMFLVHAKNLKLDGNNPVILYGYGGFRSSANPYFSATAVIMAEHGGVFAYPALRGGLEFGEEWHRAAMYENKQNTFDDFIAAAEWLIDNNYTNPSKLAIMGGSNGGLLVGATMAQRPDLMKVVLCTYPLLDMLRYHKFLMGPYWVTEYGSADEPDQFDYIYAYSPYHNIKKGVKYPAVLFVTGDSDTRVDPMHARKMTALMQVSTGSDNPVLLMYDTKAGHVGGKPLSLKIKDYATEIAFLLNQLGVL